MYHETAKFKNLMTSLQTKNNDRPTSYNIKTGSNHIYDFPANFSSHSTLLYVGSHDDLFGMCSTQDLAVGRVSS